MIQCSIGTRGSSLVTVMAVSVALATTGCTSSRSKPLRDFETIHVQASVRPADGVQAKGDQDTANKGAGVGAKGGAAAGAATSLACGPFIMFCLPVLITAGVVVGSASGGAIGGLADALDKYPRAQADQIESILQEIESSRDFFVEVRDGVRKTVRPERRASAEEAEAIVYVGPERIELVQNESSHLALRLTVAMNVQWDREKRTPRHIDRRYTHTTSVMPIEYWLSEDGRAFNNGFSECIDKIIEAIGWDLEKANRVPASRNSVAVEQ